MHKQFSHLSMWNKLLHHLLQRVLIIHNHLAQPGVLPVTAATHRSSDVVSKYLFLLTVYAVTMSVIVCKLLTSI